MTRRKRTTETGGTDLGTLTVAIATLAAVGLGAGVSSSAGGGVLVPTAAGALAGLAVGASLSVLQSSSLARQALGSCGLVVGLGLLAPATLGAGILAITAAVATGATTIALVPGSSPRQPASHAVRSSAVTATGASGVGLLAVVGGGGTALLFLTGLFVAATSTPFFGFVTLQVLAVAAVLFGVGALSVLDPIVPDGVSVPSIDALAGRVSDLPPAVQYALVGQALLWFFPGTAGVFESTLVALGPVGAAVATALTSGVLHVSLGIVVFLAAVVCVASALSPFVRLWLDPYPLRTLAFAAGGIPVALAALAAGFVLAPGTMTPVWVLAAVFAAALTGIEVSTRSVIALGWEDTWRPRLLGVGALGLFATTIVAALSGLAAPLVFVGVAASILVWDVGENALSMRSRLGRGVDSRQAELVHAIGSALAGAVGVGVAVAAMYGLGTVSPPPYRWQAVVPVTLGLAAVIAFAMALLGRHWSVGSGRFRPGRLARWFRSAVSHPVAGPVGVSITIAVVMVAAAGTEYAPFFFFVIVVCIPIVLLLWTERNTDYTSSSKPRNPPPRM